MKKILSTFIKGIGIGVAMIIPGVSGGTLAVLLNIYTDLIDSINGIFRHFGKSMKVLIPVLLGAVVGFLGLVFPLKLGLEKCPLIIIALFVGLIIGGIPSLYRKVRGEESIKNIIIGLIALAIMIPMCFLTSVLSFDLSSMSIGLWFYLLLAGVIIAATLVIPGISGSMMLMCLGLYEAVLFIISDLLKFNNILHNINVIIPLAIGAIAGFFLISFIMGKLLKTKETPTYFAIIGFVIGSIFTIGYKTFTDTGYKATFSEIQIAVSVAMLFVGFALSFFIERYVYNHSVKEVNNDETR